MKREFGVWEKAECDRCGDEFQVTRTEPRTIEEAVCESCEMYAKGYADGKAEGNAIHQPASSTKSMYVVWCPAKGEPTKRHETQADAIAEAKRLAEKNQGFEYIVLRAVQGIRYSISPFICTQYSKKG